MNNVCDNKKIEIVPYIQESCVISEEEAEYAFSQGADFVELCSHIEFDGLTPKMSTAKKLCAQYPHRVKIMISPFYHNYLYTPTQKLLLIDEIKSFDNMDIKGMVIGALVKDVMNNLIVPDIAFLQTICHMFPRVEFTFHKAIDMCSDMRSAALMIARNTDIHAILTSGGQCTAEEGVHTIVSMREDLAPYPIDIIAAGKITYDNKEALSQRLGVGYIHGRKLFI